MSTRTRHPERREDALSRERIVAAAVELLDDAGESGLTFRALGARLKTGPGAIYWHVANKEELLAAATEAVLADATTIGGAAAADAAAPGATTIDSAEDTPEDTIRAVALRVFDAIDAHPWIGTQLARALSQPALRLIFERIGQQLKALGVPETAHFMSASALLNYIVGVGGQNAANARAQPPATGRAAVLAAEAAAWENLDPDEFPFLRNLADELRDHDDRAQFLAGVDLILAGVSQLRQSPAGDSPGPPAGRVQRPTTSNARTAGR